ncbi:hypothetical protein [Marmoricola sp. Leaf446]|uniref:hypothetical protein n=1 Tax=Marmoricola sp. Leaf446 TaxID=1736379 RepID=UPI0012E35366|nr:hypothetical protein [Marmoricola sp. Leaf446]
MVNTIPLSLLDEAWGEVVDELEFQDTTVPPGTDLGGLSLDAARTCYAYLICQLRINFVAGVLLGTPELFLWAIRPHNLVGALSRRVTQKEAEAFVALFTYSSDRSAIASPLLEHDDQLLIPQELVSPIAVERTLLRAATANPAASGNLGNVLGDRATRWERRLSSIPGCEVITEVPIRDRQRRKAGDLDVVALDRRSKRMLIVEAKWPVDAATLAESYKVDATFDKGKGQIRRIRSRLESGEILVDWPPGWHSPTRQTTVDWWVASAQQLDSRPDAGGDDITTTSLRLVESLLPADDLDALIDRVTNFPLPHEGRDFRMHSRRVDVGTRVLTYDSIEILADLPLPREGRLINTGWT